MLIILESHHDLRISAFDPASILDLMLLMLKHLGGLDPVDLAVDLAHKGNGDVLHKVQNVHGGPGTLPVEVGGVGPLVR